MPKEEKVGSDFVHLPPVEFRRQWRDGKPVPLSAEEKKKLFATFCPPEEDTVRAEFAADLETRRIVERFGAGVSFGPVRSGVTDYTVTFQEAIHAVRDAQDAFDRLPEEVRSKYGGWRGVAGAIERGELKAPTAPAGSSGGAGGASPSDSAAEAK